jgi:hypothetical protein
MPIPLTLAHVKDDAAWEIPKPPPAPPISKAPSLFSGGSRLLQSTAVKSTINPAVNARMGEVLDEDLVAK